MMKMQKDGKEQLNQLLAQRKEPHTGPAAHRVKDTNSDRSLEDMQPTLARITKHRTTEERLAMSSQLARCSNHTINKAQSTTIPSTESAANQTRPISEQATHILATSRWVKLQALISKPPRLKNFTQTREISAKRWNWMQITRQKCNTENQWKTLVY